MIRHFLTISALALTVAACGEKTATPAGDAPAAVAAPAGQNWVDTVTATPEGGFRMGNPNAKVKLVEYASLTCSHCAHFHTQILPDLKKKWIDTGMQPAYVPKGRDWSTTWMSGWR